MEYLRTTLNYVGEMLFGEAKKKAWFIFSHTAAVIGCWKML
jgi:hypothetical protein